MLKTDARITLATPVTDRHVVGPVWRLWAPLAFALLIAVLHYAAPDFTWEVFFTEGWGLIELAHFVVPLAASAVALLTLLRLPQGASPGIRLSLGVLAAGCFYIAGEEHSWGQHFFGWETPEGWDAYNRQNETNLHNASSWLNHKPRVVLNLFVLATVVILPIAAARGRLAGLRQRFAFVLPGRSCHVLGWLVIFYMAYDSGRKAGFLPYISPRDAEMHELYLYGFLLVYVLTLKARVAEWRGAA